MTDFLLQHYLLLKALHIIAVIAWMAGMLYLPRLYVYHADAPKGSDTSETFKVMERRLLRYITNPAMIAAFTFGVLMVVANPELMKSGWLHVKFTALVVMFAAHGMFAKWRKVFERDENIRPAKFYKIWNEVPTLLMIVIVIMAVMKPF